MSKKCGKERGKEWKKNGKRKMEVSKVQKFPKKVRMRRNWQESKKNIRMIIKNVKEWIKKSENENRNWFEKIKKKI